MTNRHHQAPISPARRVLPVAAGRTRRDVWGRGAERLRRSGIDGGAASLEAELLLRHAAGLTREELLARPEMRLEEPSSAAYTALITRRMEGVPIAYLVGRREFFGIDLLVDRRVLIPRPETERLVEVVLDALRDRTAPSAVDVGTGCGAIAVALATARPDARVLATDVSGAALELARINAERCGVGDRITWIQGPALDPLDRRPGRAAVDAIVANPPYIPTSQLAGLPREVRGHEPVVALDGGPDGLDIHRPIIADAARHLAPGGVLALEVAALWDQAGTVCSLIEAAGGFGPTRIVRDHAGAERVVVAIRRHDGHHRR